MASATETQFPRGEILECSPEVGGGQGDWKLPSDSRAPGDCTRSHQAPWCCLWLLAQICIAAALRAGLHALHIAFTGV